MTINTSQVLTNFDVFANAGGENVATTKTFTATANSSGNIVISFVPTKDNAIVNGLEITQLPNLASPDPASPCWTNAKPIPVSYALVGHTTGPTGATDPFHVDWDSFCSGHASNCDSNGNPHYVSNDTNMIANTFPTSFYGQGITYICSGAYVVSAGTSCQDQVGVYYATSSDPLVTINVALGKTYSGWGPSGNSGSLNGSAIYIPYGALAQLPGDGHLSVHQPSGVVCQLWQTQYGNNPPKPVTSTTLSVAGGGCAGQDLTTEGTASYAPASGYAASDETSRGLIRAEDIVGNNGDGTDSTYPTYFSHALYGAFSSNRSGAVWPAVAGDGSCSLSQNGGAMPVEGMYFYLDAAGYALVQNWNAPAYLRPVKRFLGTLHKHGMLDLDSSDQSPCQTDPSQFYVSELMWGPQAIYQATGTSLLDSYLANYIKPSDASYAPSGSEQAIYLNHSGSQYTFAMLHYQDVPGLAVSNFHWLNQGCGQLAVEGSTGSNSC